MRSLALLLPCLILAAPSWAQEADATRSPYFFVRSEDPTLDRLPLKGTSVAAAIAGVIAEVKVTQVYRNTGSRPLEAVYVFPGSTRAAVHGLTMTIGARVVRADIRERGQARRDYEAARGEGRTASLLEQERPNVFQMNVANILPGDEVRVELAYTELLVPAEGTYAFVYPTVVGPRYAGVPGTASHTGEAWVANPYTKAGEPPSAAFDLHVTLAAGMPIQRMTCDTHPAAIAYDGATRASLKLADPAGANRDFILKYQLAGGAVQSGLLLHRGEKENFFLVLAQPPKRVAPKDMPAREYVFIMDVSGSQMGFPIEVSKLLMKEMIRGLRPQDRFNVMVFEGSSALLWPASRPATAEHLQEAVDFVHQQNGGGGTELGAAMKRALTLPRTPGYSRTFAVSTDGYISADGTLFDLIREHLGEANLFAFGIGSSVNRHLIEGMAHAGMGEAFVVTKPEEAPREAARFRAYVDAPVLTNVKLTASGFQIYDVEPAGLPDVLAERPVLCYGKWRGEAKGTLTLSGFGGAGAWKQSFDAASTPADSGNAALRQLWARERIRLLSDYEQFGARDERTRQITSLGLAYSLLTAYTSFVAIDSEVRNTTAWPTSVTQPLPLPQGVSNAAVGGAVPSSPAPLRAMAKRAAEEAKSEGPRNRQDLADSVGSREVAGGRGLARLAKGSMPTVASAPGQGEAAPRPVLVKSLAAEAAGADLATLRAFVDSRLKEAMLQGLLTGIPEGTRIRLTLDATGRVTRVAFDRPFPKSEALRKALVAWRLPAGSGVLKLGVGR